VDGVSDPLQAGAQPSRINQRRTAERLKPLHGDDTGHYPMLSQPEELVSPLM